MTSMKRKQVLLAMYRKYPLIKKMKTKTRKHNIFTKSQLHTLACQCSEHKAKSSLLERWTSIWLPGSAPDSPPNLVIRIKKGIIAHHVIHCFLMLCLHIAPIRPHGPRIPSVLPNPPQDWGPTVASPEPRAPCRNTVGPAHIFIKWISAFILAVFIPAIPIGLFALQWPTPPHKPPCPFPFCALYGMFFLLLHFPPTD